MDSTNDTATGTGNASDDRVFPAARRVLDHLLDELEQRAPGLITGAHITGSIALGEGRPGQSDIDLVLARDAGACNDVTLAALESTLADLRRIHPTPMLDGLVLNAGDLAAGPDRIDGDRPIIFDSVARLGPDGSGRNPVTWQTLRQCGITYRGTPIDLDRLWHDPNRLDAWTRENLESYWRPWLERSERLATSLHLDALVEEATEWGVLGVTRLHHTLATGRITSKHGAGRYALETFPDQWHRIVHEALRIRERRSEGRQYRNSFQRRRDMRAYVAMVIEDALTLPASGGAKHGIVGPSTDKEISR